MADAVPTTGHNVWGVVYEIDDRDVSQLDEREGYLPGRQVNAYRREERHVLLGGDDGKPLPVAVYFATPKKIRHGPVKNIRPRSWRVQSTGACRNSMFERCWRPLR